MQGGSCGIQPIADRERPRCDSLAHRLGSRGSSQSLRCFESLGRQRGTAVMVGSRTTFCSYRAVATQISRLHGCSLTAFREQSTRRRSPCHAQRLTSGGSHPCAGRLPGLRRQLSVCVELRSTTACTDLGQTRVGALSASLTDLALAAWHMKYARQRIAEKAEDPDVSLPWMLSRYLNRY